MLTLQFCVNYGGRAEIVDAARRVAELAAAGRLDPAKLTEDRFRQFLDEPEIPDVDLFVRSSGEQRTSNFLLWQSAYAEMVFLDRLWPDFDRRDLWRAIEAYAASRPPLRRSRTQSIRAAERVPVTPLRQRPIVRTSWSRWLQPSVLTAQQSAQVPKISRSWLTSRKLCSRGHRVGPLLHRRAGHLDGPAAAAADQMVVVAGRAAPVGGLAVGGPQRVQLAGVGHRLQGAVDRGQPDPLAQPAQLVVDLLRGPELVASSARIRPPPCAAGCAAGRRGRVGLRHRSSVLVVVVGVGGVPVALVQEVGVVAVLDGLVAAARTRADAGGPR